MSESKQSFLNIKLKALVYRSRRRPKVVSKKVVVKIFARWTGKHLRRYLPFKSVADCTKISLHTFRIKIRRN